MEYWYHMSKLTQGGLIYVILTRKLKLKISMQLVLRKSSYKPFNLDHYGRTNGRPNERTLSLLEAPPALQGRLKSQSQIKRAKARLLRKIQRKKHQINPKKENVSAETHKILNTSTKASYGSLFTDIT